MAKKEKQKSHVPHKSAPKPKAKVASKPAAPVKVVAPIKAAVPAKHAAPVKPVSKVAIKPAPAATKQTPVAAKVSHPAKPAASPKPVASTKTSAVIPATKAPIKVTKSPTIVVPLEKAPKSTEEKPSKKNALRESILARKAALKPIAFSLEEVRAIAKTIVAREEASPEVKVEKVAAKPSQAKIQAMLEKQIKPSHVQAASLADILGFNPKKQEKPSEFKPEEEVPEKYRKYYRLLIDMRKKLTQDIELHSEESLKRSAKDDSGDLSAYGQNMSDGGLNTFDRDFVLSLVSSEQDALTEIDSAIKRIHDGTYGICETTGKQIPKDRLMAVPFTRHCAEAKKNIEKNHYRARTQPGLFGEMGDEGGSIPNDDSGGDE